jgi:hypothetical protein
MDSATLNVIQRVLAAYGSQRDDINDSDLDDEQPLKLTVYLTLGDIRRARMMVIMNGHNPADFRAARTSSVRSPLQNEPKETKMSNCELCGEPMPEGETMFKYHGYSGPCPKPPLPKDTQPRVSDMDLETVQILLDLLNPLHGEIDRQLPNQFTDEEEWDAPADREYNVNITAQMERDLTQAVMILERRRRDYIPPTAA